MKAYYSIFRMRRKMETQYRGAVLGGLICQTFFGLVLVAIYRAMYAGKPQPMPLSSITTYVWLQQAFFRMLLSMDTDLLDRIRTGAIAYDLCRPLHLYGYYYSRILAMKMTGSILRALPMLVIAALLPAGWGLALPASVPALLTALAALILGLFCICALENVTMGLTMRTLDPRGVQVYHADAGSERLPGHAESAHDDSERKSAAPDPVPGQLAAGDHPAALCPDAGRADPAV